MNYPNTPGAGTAQNQTPGQTADTGTASIDALIAAAQQFGARAQGGTGNGRKAELMQKSLSSTISPQENSELAQIMSAETGLREQTMRGFMTEQLSKALGTVATAELKPVLVAQSEALQNVVGVLAKQIADHRSESDKWSRAFGQLQAAQTRNQTEAYKLIKSLQSEVETLKSRPVGGPRGIVQPGQIQQQVVPQPGMQAQPQPQALGAQGLPTLSKAQVVQGLTAMCERSRSGERLPYGIGAIQAQEALIKCDADEPPNAVVYRAVCDELKLTSQSQNGQTPRTQAPGQ